MLREADASLTFRKVPKEVETFLDHYKWLVGLMKDMVARNKNQILCFSISLNKCNKDVVACNKNQIT